MINLIAHFKLNNLSFKRLPDLPGLAKQNSGTTIPVEVSFTKQ